MIRGLDKFRAHFTQHQDAFILIGGVACHEWLATQGMQFRATKDIDMVLVIEALDAAFVAQLWDFIKSGKYTIKEKLSGDRELYRFSRPDDDTFPAMIEIFSLKPGAIDLQAGQQIVPITIDETSASLFAILLDDAYYALITEYPNKDTDLPFVNPVALIPLKARAWLDLTKRERAGEPVDAKDIAKHRTDVFRIAATLPGEPGPELPESICQDLRNFLDAFPPKSPEWQSILASLKTTFPHTPLGPENLANAIRTYFRIQ
jgi:hypothetical protein